MEKDYEDTKLIECAKCGMPLNGLNLWVVGDKNPETWCEDCYWKLFHKHELPPPPEEKAG